jgi:hypothetical protein
MIANTHARTGAIKRTKPRLQSGEAVKNVQQGTARREQIEECDQDLQRMRKKNSRQRIQDLEMIFRLSTVEHEIAHLLTRHYSSDEVSFDRDSEEEAICVADKPANASGDTSIRRTKRTKPRSQSGGAVAHLSGRCEESKVVARVGTSVELHDSEVLTRRHRTSKRKAASCPASE